MTSQIPVSFTRPLDLPTLFQEGYEVGISLSKRTGTTTQLGVQDPRAAQQVKGFLLREQLSFSGQTSQMPETGPRWEGRRGQEAGAGD